MGLGWLGSLVMAILLNWHLTDRRRRDRGQWIIGAIVFGLFSTVVLLATPLGRSRLCEYCRMRIPDNAIRCAYCQKDDPFTLPAS